MDQQRPAGSARSTVVTMPWRLPFRLMSADLHALAEAYGVATGYWDQSGQWREVADSVLCQVLTALGADPRDEDSVRRSLRHRREADWRRVLPPVFIHRADRESTIWVHVPHGSSVAMGLLLEDGETVLPLVQTDDWTAPKEITIAGAPTTIGQASFIIPAGLPLGWHTVRATTVSGRHECPLVVSPPRLSEPAPGWGYQTQLYATRSLGSWGIGDLEDLASLSRLAAGQSADFVLVNPLFAGGVVTPLEPSPYLPTTRRFFDPIYLRVEDITGYGTLSVQDRGRIEALGAEVRALNHTDGLLDRDRVWSAKRAALAQLARLPLTAAQQESFSAFLEREGLALTEYAQWCAFTEELGPYWPDWPEIYQDPASPQCQLLAAELASHVDFHRWCQWQLDLQLAHAQQTSREAGMEIGVVHDLAVGVHGQGADSWRLQHLLLSDVTVGAPPDVYNQQGQNWAQPPWWPDALAEQGFRPWRDILRTVLRHAGGIRIDHVLGLFRQWWVPEGNSADQGTYVSMDHEALVSILVLEAHRAGAVVIGEDLGTVEDWISAGLAERGILGTGILWFKTVAGQVQDPDQWRFEELASVGVHDLPPTEAFIRGDHIRLRAELGVLARPPEDEFSDHRQELGQWAQLLQQWQLVSPELAATLIAALEEQASTGSAGWEDVPTEAFLDALQRLLARKPPRLLAVSLTDLVGEQVPQNQPGTHREYPNWCVPLTDRTGAPVLLEDLADIADPVSRGWVATAG